MWGLAQIPRLRAGQRTHRALARGFSSVTHDFYSEIRAAGGAFKWLCDGQWLESTSGKTVGVINPSTRKKDFDVQACTQQEVDAAFQAAKTAQRSWASTPLWRRAQLLHRVAELMRQHAQPIADSLVREVAKPAKQSLDEVVRWGGTHFSRWAA
jgi:glyceraldehyde-3-phosphate dehydrogenase (NADP+)